MRCLAWIYSFTRFKRPQPKGKPVYPPRGGVNRRKELLALMGVSGGVDMDDIQKSHMRMWGGFEGSKRRERNMSPLA